MLILDYKKIERESEKMKKINSKGFTLVELLAVIVIMGILMMVAIPSVTRTIENSRKDTYVDIAKSYANAARTLWTADGLTCNGTVSSAVDDGDYYIAIDTREGARDNLPVLVDQGGKSSWGNRDIQGYVRVHIETKSVTAAGNTEAKRTTSFYVAITDGTHSIQDDDTLTSDELKRGNVKMTSDATLLNSIKLTTDAKDATSGKYTGALACTWDSTNSNYTCTNFKGYTPTANTAVNAMKGICVES